MPIEITIPRLGWSMEEGNFLGWLKKDGETVKSGDPLFTLESEKSAQDVEATDGGILRIAKDSPQSGDVVKVGLVIGHLLTENEPAGNGAPASKAPPAEAKPHPAAKEEPKAPSAPKAVAAPDSSSADEPEVAVSPRARRRAREMGVNIAGLKGSGSSGRVVEADVLKNARTPGAVSMTSMRRTIARRTAESFSTTPHFYLRCELDATELLRLREDLLPEVEGEAGTRLTLTDLILRAQAMALRDCPAANAVWIDDEIVPLPSCDVGLVVGLPSGLLIPIVRSPEARTLADLARQRSGLVEGARAGKLKNDAFEGGATSFSNLGTTRVDEFAAVISPRQSSMLAVGRAFPRPYEIKGKLALRSTLRFCLSVDHRVMDGGPAAEFLGCIVALLEEPRRLVEAEVRAS